MGDRTVHARHRDGHEIVRYRKAGKWWLERADGTRAPLQVPTAVSEAADWTATGDATILWDQPGGKLFDSRLRAQLAAW